MRSHLFCIRQLGARIAFCCLLLSNGYALFANSLYVASEFDAQQEYGKLRVTEGRFVSESSYKPWSAWWFPLKKRQHVNRLDSEASPLERFDQFVRNTYRKEWSSAAEERQSINQREEREMLSSYDGYCGGWALASILLPEPQQPIVRGGVTFRVVDQKALLALAYQEVEGLRRFGTRFTDPADHDYQDVHPQDFHRVMISELFEKKIPFIIDHDPSWPVWHVPVWKARIDIKLSENKQVVHVEAVLETADARIPQNHPGEIPDYKGLYNITRKYTYDLMGVWQTDGSFLVQSGRWTGKSRKDHPDYIITRPSNEHRIKRTPRNTMIVPQMIDQLFSSSY